MARMDDWKRVALGVAGVLGLAGISLAQDVEFRDAEIVADASTPLVGDFDEDGHVDLLVLPSNADVDRDPYLLRGRGDGTFESAAPVTGLLLSRHAAVVHDVDGDGHLDVLGTTDGVYTDAVLALDPLGVRESHVAFGDGEGGFQYVRLAELPGSEVRGTGYTQEFVAGDLDRDGHIDLAVGFYDPDGRDGAELRDTAVLFGLGERGFAAPVLIGVFDSTPVAITAFEDDDPAELVLSIHSPGTSGGQVRRFETDRTHRATATFTSPGGTFAAARLVVDVDGDRRRDVLGIGRNGRQWVWSRTVTGGFLPAVGRGISRTIIPYVDAAIDIDNDGDLDLVSHDFTGSAVWIDLCDRAGRILTTLTVPLAAPMAAELVVADVDADGLPDLLVSETRNDTLQIVRRLGAPPPLVTRIAPRLVTGAGTHRVTLFGSGFGDGASLEFDGPGTLSAPIRATDTLLEFDLTLPEGTGGGLRNVTVVNPDGQRATARLVVRALEFQQKKGRAKDAAAPGRDSLQVRGPLQLTGLVTLDGAAGLGDEVRLSFGAEPRALDLTLASDAPGWRTTRRGLVYRYRSPKGEFPRVRLTIDLLRNRYSLRVTHFDFAAPLSATNALGLELGDATGEDLGQWRSSRRDRKRLKLTRFQPED